MATFEIRSSSSLELVLRNLRAKGESAHKALPAIAELLVGGVQDVFEAEGPGWKPLAESTLRRRRKNGRGAKILQDTGAAAGSIGPGFGADYAEAFAGVDYLVFHTRSDPPRNPFDLGPFEGPLLEEVADLLLQQAT